MARFVDPLFQLVKIRRRRVHNGRHFDRPQVHAVDDDYEHTLCGRPVPMNQMPTIEVSFTTDDRGLCQYCRHKINEERKFRAMETKLRTKRKR